MAAFEFTYKSQEGADLLLMDGPLVEVLLTAPLPLVSYLRDNALPAYPVREGFAVVDTGASVSVVEESIMAELDIPYVDSIFTQTIHGEAESRRFNASVSFPGLGLFGIALNVKPGGSIRTLTFPGGEVIMLLGRDLLRNFVVTYDGPGSKMIVKT